MHWITHLEGGPKRVNHAAVAVGHKIYSFGGYCTGENSRQYTSMDVHVLNTTTFRWTKHPVSDLPYFENDDILPYKRYGHTAVLYGNKVYVWGGRNDRASCSVLFCFDTDWHCWTAPPTSGTMPLARDGHSACVWRHYMYIFGGFEETPDAFAKYMYVLDLKRMHWSYVKNTGPLPKVRDFHTTVVIENRMYLFGGRGTMFHRRELITVEVYSPKLWYFDFLTNRWNLCQVTGDVPVGRRSHSAFEYNGKMYIFGGFNAKENEHYNDLYEFNPATNAWKKLSINGSKGPCRRRRQACVLVKDQVFLFGGTSPKPLCSAEGDNPETTDDTLVDHSDMYVLDFRPSLKTLAKLAVRKYKLSEAELPSELKMEIKNMFTPNKITINRPSNYSAG